MAMIYSEQEKYFMNEAIKLSINAIHNHEGGPFGAVVVKDGKIVGKGNNMVTSLNDPTAHAEVMAIRDACKNLNTFQLKGCVIYTSCEPCPMCLGAIYWARPDKVIYACTRKDAEDIGFDDNFIYKEISMPIEHRAIPMMQMGSTNALDAFNIWKLTKNKTEY